MLTNKEKYNVKEEETKINNKIYMNYVMKCVNI